MFHPEPTPRRPGLVAGCLLLLLTTPAFTAPPETPLPLPATLDDSRVVISYADLRQLIERASTRVEPEPPLAPPVPACLIEARYHLRFEQNEPRLEAAFTVENLSATWAALPLGEAGAATLAEALPAGLRLARQNDQLLLVLEKTGRATCLLQLLPTARGAFEWSVPAAAALAALEIDAPPPTHSVQFTWPDGVVTTREHPLRTGLTPAQGPVRLSVVDRQTGPPASPPALDAALISEAAFQSQIARDGAQLTQVVLRVEHRTASSLRLTLPDQAELLRGSVAGRPLPAEVTARGGTLDLPLPAPDSATVNATEVTLTYFAQGTALHPSEGEFNLALPRTPLLMHRLDWTIELPEGLEISAQGNAEPVPLPAAGSASPTAPRHTLQLTRRLCRDSLTQVRLTYRLP